MDETKKFKVISKIETDVTTFECGDIANIEFMNEDVLTCRIESIKENSITVLPVMFDCIVEINICNIADIY